MKSTHKQLLRLFLVLTCLYGIYYSLTIYLANALMPPAQQSIVFLNDIINKKIKITPPKTIILGDSTAAFSYSAKLAPQTLSLAIFSGSFAEIYYAYKKYLKFYPSPKCIVLSASYNWAYHRDGRFWDIYAVNDFYDLKDLNEIYETSERVKDFPANNYTKFEFFFKYFIYKLRLQGIHLTDIQDFFKKQTIYKGNQRFYKLMRENNGSINKSNAVFPFMWEPHSHINQAFTSAPLYDEYLKRLVNLAVEQNTIIHWIQIPVSKQLDTFAGNKHYFDIEKHLKPIILKGNNTFDGKIIFYEDKYLFSATHLNNAGAKKFTLSRMDLFNKCNEI